MGIFYLFDFIHFIFFVSGASPGAAWLSDEPWQSGDDTGFSYIGLINPNSGQQSLEGADWRYHNHEQIMHHHLREFHVQG